MERNDVNVVSRRVDLTNYTEGVIKDRILSSLNKFDINNMKATMTLSSQNDSDAYKVKFNLTGDHINDIRVEKMNFDIMTAVSEVLEIVSRHLRKQKDILKTNKKNGKSVSQVLAMEETEFDDSGYDLIRGDYLKNIVKTKKFVIDESSIEDAINNMEELGHDFWIFKNSSDTLLVVYRRGETYGLIVLNDDKYECSSELVSRVKHVRSKPLPLEVAILDLEMSGFTFWVYVNGDNDKPEVLYVREIDSDEYGRIIVN